MKTYKKVEQIRTLEDKTFCDICNKEVRIETCDAFECNIELRTGQNYPDGGWGIKYNIDICPDCIEGFLDLLKTNGIRITEEEWDF